MNINLFRLTPLVRELRRLNANFELLLEHVYGVRPHPSPSARNAKDESEVLLSDEDRDLLREWYESQGKEMPPQKREPVFTMDEEE